jgi:hypothetical protein
VRGGRQYFQDQDQKASLSGYENLEADTRSGRYFVQMKEMDFDGL